MNRIIKTYPDKTPHEVRYALQEALTKKLRLRLFYGDPTTGEVWPEENDVTGYVGTTIGNQSAILVHNARSHGGSEIIGDHVLAIYTTTGLCTYRHKNLNFGDWRMEESKEGGANYPLKYSVLHNGDVHAGFEDADKARRYIQFMTAQRFSK